MPWKGPEIPQDTTEVDHEVHEVDQEAVDVYRKAEMNVKIFFLLFLSHSWI